MIHSVSMNSRDDWLKARLKYIGGSEASAIVGMNPYMSSYDLWLLKTRQRKPEELDDNPFIIYGQKAEEYLRQLFILDYPEYKMEYYPNTIFVNDRYPYAHASLDGLLTDRKGRTGIWECKTSMIQNPIQKMKWEGKIPENYYCQICWYMAVLEADFAELKAQLKYEKNGNILLITKHYHIERGEVASDIEYLMSEARTFWNEYVIPKKAPPVVLPEI